jgi:hypothetical protein
LRSSSSTKVRPSMTRLTVPRASISPPHGTARRCSCAIAQQHPNVCVQLAASNAASTPSRQRSSGTSEGPEYGSTGAVGERRQYRR